MSSGATLGDRVGEVFGDGAGEPSADDAVHPDPIRGVGEHTVGEDMVLQGEFPEGEEKGFTTPGVEG